MALIVAKPDYFTSSARDGLMLFSSSVLPAISPFFFCSLLLTKIGGVYTISRVFGKPASKLFGAPEISAFPAFISLVSGYPAGASTLKNLYDNGYATTEDIKRMLPFTSTSGPLFILGTVAGAIYEDSLIGAIVLLSHYLATFLNGLIWKRKSIATDGKFLLKENVDEDISGAVSSSAIAMLSVGGYIVVCNMLIDALALLPVRLPALLSALVYGGIEMTRGTIFASKITSIDLSIATATAVCTFGGLSVTLQSYGFLSPCGIRFREYLIRKITQTILAFIIALIFSSIF